MGKSLFTTEQQYIFDKVAQNPFLKQNFYFTGGTALSYFYLQHRYSEDLDFFSEKKFAFNEIEDIVKGWLIGSKLTYSAQEHNVVSIFVFNFPNSVKLKVDFGYYPYKRVETERTHQGFAIDSLLDIAINKLSTINQRTKIKDFVDLYYLLDKFTIWDLIEGVRVKFKKEIDYWLLSSDLSIVEDFTALPRMIKPLTLEQLKKYFHDISLKLARKVVE